MEETAGSVYRFPTVEVGTVKYLRVPKRCPKSNFPIGIIVLVEYDLNILVI